MFFCFVSSLFVFSNLIFLLQFLVCSSFLQVFVCYNFLQVSICFALVLVFGWYKYN
jgi:hypothetical protein